MRGGAGWGGVGDTDFDSVEMGLESVSQHSVSQHGAGWEEGRLT